MNRPVKGMKRTGTVRVLKSKSEFPLGHTLIATNNETVTDASKID